MIFTPKIALGESILASSLNKNNLFEWAKNNGLANLGTFISDPDDKRLPKKISPDFKDVEIVACAGEIGLELYICDLPRSYPLTPNFSEQLKHWQRTQGQLDNHPLRRAMGWEAGHSKTILDMTAGWGQDALDLALWGFQVSSIEAHPLVFKMLDTHWEHVSKEAPEAKLKFQFGNSVDFLKNAKFDSVYLDPMYPETNEMSAPTKHMQGLRKIHSLWPLENTPTAEEMLNSALQHQQNSRIVVKRPHHAPVIFPERNRGCVESKTTRWDIY